MAKRGADGNFISSLQFKEIQEEQPNIHRKVIQPAQVYKGVTEDPCWTFKMSANMDVLPQIRHGSALSLRSVGQKIMEKKVPLPIMGRKALQSLGCDNREIVMAARGRYGDDIDAENRLKRSCNQEESEGEIDVLFGEYVFHNGGPREDDGFDEEDMYIDLGDVCNNYIESKLEKHVSEAVRKGLSGKR